MTTNALTSPIQPLIKHLTASPFLVAAERDNELKELVDQHDIHIEFIVDDDSALLEVYPQTGLIRFGLAFAERIWAYAYAYMEVMAKVQHSDPGVELRLAEDPETNPAIQLLGWAHACERSKQQVPWPDGLPRHVIGAEKGSPSYAADEMFLCIGGWALLHEIGHVVGRHHARGAKTSTARHELEYEADDWASHWILDKCPSDARIRTKRSLGAAFGLSIISTFEVYDREGDSSTHPDPLKRLLHFLDNHVPETPGPHAGPIDLVWWAAQTILMLHLMNSGKTPAPEVHENFRAALITAIEMFDE